MSPFVWVAGPGAEGRDGGFMRNARNCPRCKNGKSKRVSKHLVCVGGCGQCRERLVSVSGAEEERRQLPPRLDCPPSLFCLCPPPTLLPPELPSIKSQLGARWLRPTLTSPPPPPPSSTQPAGHWRQGPEVSQFYAAPWTLCSGGYHRMAGGERADEGGEAGGWPPPPA